MEVYPREQVEKLLNDCHVELVNCDSLGKMFWRYIPLSRLEEMLNKNKLIFVYPELWKDPFEKLYLKTDFSAINNYKRPEKFYCLCGRGNGNEDASWNVYSEGDEPMICVRFNLKKLLPRIRSFVGSDCNIYYSKICYDLSTSEIKNIQSKQSLNKYLPNSFSEKDYIRLMSLKRQSFKYEDEYRIFIIPKENCSLKEKKGLIQIPINYDIFERFTIGPMKRIKKANTSTLLKKIEFKQYQMQCEQIENFIKEYFGGGIPIPYVCKSTLYNDVLPIAKIQIEKIK